METPSTIKSEYVECLEIMVIVCIKVLNNIKYILYQLYAIYAFVHACFDYNYIVQGSTMDKR